MVYLRAKSFKRKNDNVSRKYFYIVDSKKVNGTAKQKVIRYLGTADSILEVYHELDRLKSKSL